MGTTKKELTVLDSINRISFLKKPVRSLVLGITSISPVRRLLRRAFRHQAVSKRVWQYLPVRAEFQIQLPAGERFHYSVGPGDGVGKGLYWQGIASLGGEFEFFYERAKRSCAILDIGANTGIFSLIACAANPAAEVIAFEPVSHVFQRLLANVKLNKFESRCRALQVAASDAAGVSEILLPPGEIPTEATLETLTSPVPGDNTLASVATTTIDIVCRHQHVDFVKIGVEGSEHKVLKGMSRLIARCKPTILLEHHSNCPAHTVQDCLAPYEYRMYRITDDGDLNAIRSIEPGIRAHYIFTP